MSNASLLSTEDVGAELDRMLALIADNVADDKACVLASGGLDSDVVARLTARAIGADRLKLVTIIQDDMEDHHLEFARKMAGDIGVRLVELDMRGIQLDVMHRLANADPEAEFQPRGLIDPNRMKCSLRTAITSTYQDRKHLIIGTSNRTEIELGFFLPFGDAIWHVGPLAHLYKTEVRAVAREVGTAAEVLEQPPSAGFWKGQTDREDLGFWMLNGGPVHTERDFTDAEVEEAAVLSSRLDERAVDELLLQLSTGTSVDDIEVGLDVEVVRNIARIVEVSQRWKRQPLGVQLVRQ